MRPSGLRLILLLWCRCSRTLAGSLVGGRSRLGLLAACRGLRLDGGGVSRRLAASGDDGSVAGVFRLPPGMAKNMAGRPPMVCGSNGVEEPLK